jgi:hypothetical protein
MKSISSPKSMADFWAIGLSSLCVIHCLALPFLIAAIPFLGFLSEAEWVHQVLVCLAAPLGLWALARKLGLKPVILCGLLGLGLTLMAGAAFYEPWQAYEVPLTVIGASLLAVMHLVNARLKHKP